MQLSFLRGCDSTPGRAVVLRTRQRIVEMMPPSEPTRSLRVCPPNRGRSWPENRTGLGLSFASRQPGPSGRRPLGAEKTERPMELFNSRRGGSRLLLRTEAVLKRLCCEQRKPQRGNWLQVLQVPPTRRLHEETSCNRTITMRAMR